MDRRITGLDKRSAEVRQTIDTIRQMGLTCDRTPRTGEYVICFRSGDSAICQYAKTPSEALAVAKRLRAQWIV